jgi:hypothetical protein
VTISPRIGHQRNCSRCLHFHGDHCAVLTPISFPPGTWTEPATRIHASVNAGARNKRTRSYSHVPLRDCQNAEILHHERQECPRALIDLKGRGTKADSSVCGIWLFGFLQSRSSFHTITCDIMYRRLPGTFAALAAALLLIFILRTPCSSASHDAAVSLSSVLRLTSDSIDMPTPSASSIISPPKATGQHHDLRLPTRVTFDAPNTLFGSPRLFSTAPGARQPLEHPRVLFNGQEWATLVDSYATGKTSAGSWQQHFLLLTNNVGVNDQALAILDGIVIEGVSQSVVAAYFDLLGYNARGQPVVMGEASATALFQVALHAFVDTKISGNGPPSPLFARVYALLDKWATIVLAHANKYDCRNPDSPVYQNCTAAIPRGPINSGAWQQAWSTGQEWQTGVWGLALCYDVLYNRMEANPDLQAVRGKMRDAIARIVRDRRSYGMGLPAPRILQYSIPQFSNLWLANLAIEGDGHDAYISLEFPRVLREWWKRAVYEDGSYLEDGQVLSISMVQGSTAFVAAARRGENVIGTQKFRNFLYHTSQSMEPWFCGQFVGGSSGNGGGDILNSVFGMARYAYPSSPLTQMMWRQRYVLTPYMLLRHTLNCPRNTNPGSDSSNIGRSTSTVFNPYFPTTLGWGPTLWETAFAVHFTRKLSLSCFYSAGATVAWVQAKTPALLDP